MTRPSIQERLLDLVSAVPYGLETLLRLLDIRVTRTVPSAAVPLGGDPRLLLNPDFVEAWCETDEELFALVLHELHHVLLGHTRLFARVTPAHNIAFDAVINALICRGNPSPAWTSLFRKLYAPDVFPELLLRPPKGFPGRLRFPAGLEKPWRHLLVDLYGNGSATFSEIFEALTRRIDDEGAGMDIVLLGNHDHDSRGLEAGDSAGLFAAVRGIVDHWPSGHVRRGRSLSALLDAYTTALNPPATPVAVVRTALLQAARAGGSRGTNPEVRSVTGQVAWPTRDRRAFALAGAGTAPLLYETTLPARPRPGGQRPVNVYIDVSPSCHAWVRPLYEAVLSCRRWIAPQVFLFSTQVEEISLHDLSRGLVRGTAGTDSLCIAEHLATTRCEAAVVLTDGYVGPVPETYRAACRRAQLQVVLTPGGWADDLAPVATIHHMENP